MRRSRGAQAFSLVELMVALVFLGLLLAGLIRVWGASLALGNRIHLGLEAQRQLRQGAAWLREDLRRIGQFHPPPGSRGCEPATLPPTAVVLPNQPARRQEGPRRQLGMCASVN